METALTFEDVLILPQYSEVLPHEADLTTKISRNHTVKTPILSAAMDTVTEAKTAIAMAQEGGIGVIHKNLSPDQQANEVRSVKKSESGMITDPISVGSEATVGDVLALMQKYNISGLPVIDQGSLVGIVTGRDIRFEKQLRRSVTEVMTKKVITTSINSSPSEAVDILHRHRIEKLPVLAEDGKTLVGMFTIKDIEKAVRYPSASKDRQGRLLVGAAVGIGKDSAERIEALLKVGVDLIVLDTAHGHSKGVIDAVSALVKKYKKNYAFDIVAGNVATPEAVEALIAVGADGIKVGIGPGSICTTRIIAGIGVPQLSAIINCAKAAKGSGVPIIADGGIKYSGDIVKALAAGASSVMIGSLLAGTEEAPGEMIIYQGKSYKSYRGMGSLGAMAQGAKDRYFQDNVNDTKKLVPEGIEGRVAYKGSLSETLFQMVGGVRQAMGYVGARTIPELQERCQFIRISQAGLRESHTHDVYITREAPNYKVE